MSFEADKAFLQKEGVYEHIGKIINRVIAEKPVDAQGMVEVLSRLVKDPEALAHAKPATVEEVEAFKVQAKKSRELDKVPVDEGSGEPVEACELPNVIEEAEMFAWTGVGLGQQESYKVMCSLRNHAIKVKETCSAIRFWGKILGTGADYWIAEAKSSEGGEDNEEVMDKINEEGANKFVYFVATDLAGSWQQLPHITFQQLCAARLIRRLFTGDPDAKVITHPFFDGTEKVLLRAQIARITADTVLCPTGMLTQGDDADAPPEPATEESDPPWHGVPATSKLCELTAWMHMAKHIRKDGKTLNPKEPEEDPPEEGPDPKVAYFEEIEDDPIRQHLRKLGEDGLDWVVKQAGDTTLYLDPFDSEKKKSKSNAVAFVRSLVWPGAVTASQKGAFTNLYVGYGLRAGDRDFFPAAPPDVQDEPPDQPEHDEPAGTVEQEPAHKVDDD